MKKNLLGLVFIMIFFLLASCTLFTESSSASSESTSSSENTSSSDVSSSSSTTSQTASSSTISSTTISSTSTSSSSSTSSTISSSSSSSSLYSIYESTDLELISNGSYAEGVYAVFTKVTGATSYNAYYKLSTDSDYTKVDSELVRDNRVDIVGLKSNTSYDVKIVPSNASGEMTAKAKSFTETTLAYDRSGYAFFNATEGVGAYNADGTLKTNAVIVYVSDATKNTVKYGNYTGISNILSNVEKIGKPVIVRFLDTLYTAQYNYRKVVLRTSTNPNPTDYFVNTLENDDVINGLTNKFTQSTTKKIVNNVTYYNDDSYFNMQDITSTKGLTIEGIGPNAGLLQWGMTFKKSSCIEVRNLSFTDYPEDACSFEGNGNSSIDTYFGYWVHNCTFNRGKNNWDLTYEQDKYAGDGSVDLKYIKNITISYCCFNSTKKTGLVGGGDDQEQYNITFHHNYYNGCNSRLPLSRAANMHMYNNYYYNTGKNIDLGVKAYAFVENCYFENAKDPFSFRDTTGKYKSLNNVFVSCSGSYKENNVTTRSGIITNTNKYGNFDTNPALFYYDSINEKTKVTYLSTAEVAKSDCINYSGVLKK